MLLLREIDVSMNRNVDDTVVLSLHNALTMAYRRDNTKKYGFEDDDVCCEKVEPRVKKTYFSNDRKFQKLLMYITHTSITPRVEDQVSDLITLC